MLFYDLCGNIRSCHQIWLVILILSTRPLNVTGQSLFLLYARDDAVMYESHPILGCWRLGGSSCLKLTHTLLEPCCDGIKMKKVDGTL